MDKLRTILIDDELNSLQNLQQKLTEFCPDVFIVAATQNPAEAINLIRELHPDIIFLDIEMPRMSGFRLLEELGETDSEIIFTTAYSHYAIDAIRISAFDYLTKPISISDLQNTIERLTKRRQGHIKERIDILRQAMGDTKSQEDKIVIATAEGLEFIAVKNIIHIESSSNYCNIIMIDGKTMLVTKLLKDLEDILHPYRFYRIHHSHLINLNYIKKYIREDGGQVMMINDEKIDISRRKKDEFLKMIAQ